MKKLGWFVLVLFLVIGYLVYADEVSSYSRVVSRGTAEVVATPSHVEFVFVKVSSGATVEEAVSGVEGFEAKLRLKFTEESPRPVEVNVSGPFISFKDKCEVELRFSVLFSLAGIVSVADSQKLFAQLWDKMRGIANEQSLLLRGPYLKVQNKENVESSAVALAIEKAYPCAEGSASAIRGTVYAVDRIEIEGIKWHNCGEESDEPVSLTEVRCEARVSVTYLVSE